MHHTGCVYDDFVVARNPEEGSTLPYLVRIPLAERAVVLKVREKWPRMSKVYCHRATEWPVDADIVERVPVRSCVRRGAAIDLVLDRGRENRSQFVITRIRGGREAIFWQTARTAKQARPNVAVPSARALGQLGLEIVVDSHERYPYTFSHQQVSTRRAGLTAGDYAVFEADSLVASVERKSLADLTATLTSGKLKYVLGELAALPRAAVVVEDRYSQIFKLTYVRPSVVADGLAEAQVRWPNVPLVFCETRALAEEWTYRFLTAASVAHAEEVASSFVAETLPSAGPLGPYTAGSRGVRRTAAAAGPVHPPDIADVRRWALDRGYAVADRGRLKVEIHQAYAREHPD